MIGKLIKGIGMYKDGKGVMDNPAEGVADIAFDMTLKPFLIITSIILWLVVIGSLIFGILGSVKFLKPVFWIALVVLFLVRIINYFIKRLIRKVSEATLEEGQKIAQVIKEKK